MKLLSTDTKYLNLRWLSQSRERSQPLFEPPISVSKPPDATYSTVHVSAPTGSATLHFQARDKVAAMDPIIILSPGNYLITVTVNNSDEKRRMFFRSKENHTFPSVFSFLSHMKQAMVEITSVNGRSFELLCPYSDWLVSVKPLVWTTLSNKIVSHRALGTPHQVVMTGESLFVKRGHDWWLV